MPELTRGADTPADFARILDTAGVPNLLFGWTALALLGKDRGYKEVDFVINDNQVDTARKAIEDRFGAQHCSDSNCPELDEHRNAHHFGENGLIAQRGFTPEVQKEALAYDQYHPVAAIHFHIITGVNCFEILSLHRKSSLLWWLPDLELAAPDRNDRNLTVTSDDRLPTHHGCTGPWVGYYSVKILTQVAFAEALILLKCWNHPNMLGTLWGVMIGFLYPLDAQIRDLIAPEFQDLWTIQMQRGPPGATVHDAFQRLIRILKDQGRRPVQHSEPASA
ncbi:hypothetical protein BJX70DRAFT_399851 [Aspergillus crustosus]